MTPIESHIKAAQYSVACYMTAYPLRTREYHALLGVLQKALEVLTIIEKSEDLCTDYRVYPVPHAFHPRCISCEQKERHKKEYLR